MVVIRWERKLVTSMVPVPGTVPCAYVLPTVRRDVSTYLLVYGTLTCTVRAVVLLSIGDADEMYVTTWTHITTKRQLPGTCYTVNSSVHSLYSTVRTYTYGTDSSHCHNLCTRSRHFFSMHPKS